MHIKEKRGGGIRAAQRRILAIPATNIQDGAHKRTRSMFRRRRD
jgi:hypothetical protein